MAVEIRNETAGGKFWKRWSRIIDSGEGSWGVNVDATAIRERTLRAILKGVDPDDPKAIAERLLFNEDVLLPACITVFPGSPDQPQADRVAVDNIIGINVTPVPDRKSYVEMLCDPTASFTTERVTLAGRRISEIPNLRWKRKREKVRS